MPEAAFPVAEAEAAADPLALAKPVCGPALVVVDEVMVVAAVAPVAPAAVEEDTGFLCTLISILLRHVMVLTHAFAALHHCVSSWFAPYESGSEAQLW